MSVCSEKMDIINFLLQNKLVDVNARDTFGRTALHYACSAGQLELVKVLIENGADVNQKNNGGETPLIKACAFGEVLIVEYLLTLTNVDVKTLDYVDSAQSEWKNCLRHPRHLNK